VGGTSATAGLPRRETTNRSPEPTRSTSSENRRFASATPSAPVWRSFWWISVISTWIMTERYWMATVIPRAKRTPPPAGTASDHDPRPTGTSRCASYRIMMLSW